MQFGQAVVTGICQGPEGAQEVEFQVVCPAANCARLNVVAGAWRIAVALDRPPRGTGRQFKAKAPSDVRLRPGDTVDVEFFWPGEQAGFH